MKSKQKLLLLQDREDVGRTGEVVSVKLGYARNFLVPKKIAIIADANTLRMQDKLQKERAIITAQDRKESEELAKIIEPMILSITVKVDPEGKMYGSVSQQDIIDLFAKEKIDLTKKNIAIKKHIKEIGEIQVPIKLKEDVETKVTLKIIPEKVEMPKEEKHKRSEEKAKKEGSEEVEKEAVKTQTKDKKGKRKEEKTEE
ncbi:MAG: 50S ribosomal protein L9 [Parachlamydiales bacterium]|jgi:large subunit ribosomal protein L9